MLNFLSLVFVLVVVVTVCYLMAVWYINKFVEFEHVVLRMEALSLARFIYLCTLPACLILPAYEAYKEYTPTVDGVSYENPYIQSENTDE